MRRSALLAAVVLLAGCGGARSTGSFGDVTLALDSAPDANDAGVYLATARGYDEAEGVSLKVEPRGTADLTLCTGAALRGAPELVGVMAIVPPRKLLLCVRRDTLQEDRGMVKAAVRALQRGYLQAQLEPEEAVQAMADQVPGLDAAGVAARLDRVSPTWSAGSPFLGAVPRGPQLDPSIAGPQSLT